MFNRSFQDEVYAQYLWSLAEDLDHVLFNRVASEQDLRVIQKWIDVDAYNRNERGFQKANRGNLENYRSSVLYFLFRILEKMHDSDVNALENVINNILDKEITENELN